MEKQCNKCNKTLDYRMFSPSSTIKDGFRNECKNCRSDMMRNRRKKENYLPDPSIIEMECSKCKDTKSVDDFYSDTKSKTGYQHKCKSCHNIMRRK
jgi:hypothetical protein